MKKETEKKDCDCLSKVAENIKEKIAKDDKKQKGYKILEADFEYKSWFPKVRLYSNFIIKSTFEKKDGTTSRPQNEHINIFYSYCPFCGKPFTK
jgi:hypothetical protein